MRKKLVRQRYLVWCNGVFVSSAHPAPYAGIRTQKIFGRLDCRAGKRGFLRNRVFFRSYKDAILAGYRPCRVCHPVPGLTWQASAAGLGEEYLRRHRRS